jgi:hypothetical protein|uniref:Baseplate protein n=2 Tax=unclassified Caudoviricetes TaxID=2788787 RepID=A0A8S5VFE3_9CAUD|nr:MAG TPA: baseplate protein [Siphoviridae sp. ctu1o13]DAG05444.1 MAG TPA: baseplate protein [Siphoviridae sp. ct1da40]
MRLIDADWALGHLKPYEPSDEEWSVTGGTALRLIHNAIDNAPTVDAVVVTRCKDCKHLCVWNRKDMYAFCPKTNIAFLPFELDTRTFFCGFGERKEDA